MAVCGNYPDALRKCFRGRSESISGVTSREIKVLREKQSRMYTWRFFIRSEATIFYSVIIGRIHSGECVEMHSHFSSAKTRSI